MCVGYMRVYGMYGVGTYGGLGCACGGMGGDPLAVHKKP